MLCLGLISVEQRASLSEAKAGEQRAPCTRWPGAKALRHLDITSAWSTTSSRQVRKGWCDLAEANGSDTGSRQGAGQTGPTPCLHYDLTPESGSRRGSTEAPLPHRHFPQLPFAVEDVSAASLPQKSTGDKKDKAPLEG